MDPLSQFLSQYGYFAIFGALMLGIVAPFIPDDTILVLSGIAVHEGHLSMVPAIVAAYAGSLVGITVSYTLGRTGAVYALRRFKFLDRSIGKHLPQAQHWFDRYGKWTLFFGYFIAGVRHLTALFAGISGLSIRTFAAYAYPGGLTWVLAFMAIGYYLGAGWQAVAHSVNRDAVIVAGAVAVLALLVWWLKRRQRAG